MSSVTFLKPARAPERPAPTLAELRSQLAQAKADEEAAKKLRLEVEEQILACPEVRSALKDEGTTRFKRVGLKVETGFTRGWDQAQLEALYPQVDPHFWPFKAEWKEDRKASRTYEERFPDLWALLRAALTLKPKKASLSLIDPDTGAEPHA